MTTKYTIGVDYGTESGRAVLIDLSNGQELADHVTPYRHGVIDQYLPNTNIKLGHEWALQHPLDYVEVLTTSVPAVMKESGVDADDVIGIGVDFTACTMLPVDEEGQPLCLLAQYKDNPHSWVKLWKHHAAQDKANAINEMAEKRGEAFLPRYGGKISSEWMIAKVWQILDEAEDVYNRTDQFLEATDWIVSQMTGKIVKNSCTAGYKAIWHKREGYPSNEFFKALDPRLEHLTTTKLRGDIVPLGERAGGLLPEMAEKMGLNPGIAVAVGNVDAHAAVPAVGVTTPGKLVMAMGTSICHMLLGEKEQEVEGMCGVVEDGIIPGYLGYEAGQSAVGDIFAWFVKHGVPAVTFDEAQEKGVNIHALLEEKASQLRPGESGLLALDWWNGNRSILVDTELSGMLLGYTLQTKPEEIYRALLEATAFGTRAIVDAFHGRGVEVHELYACGGLPQKNHLLMQIFADVTNREIKVAASKQTPALGAAMFASVAAGSEVGGYDSIEEAAKKMGRVKDETFKPIPEHVAIYEKLYQEYVTLHDYFGRGANDVMKRLKALKSIQHRPSSLLT
ncbi:ribulokinase [Halalkalibacterium halodurans]|uniref:ribulokinase n=1 Tax=Halalkalibacterium halodurans TaxID=86665 RepID=UPI002E23AE1A|nr:ribulokinase [Halalkalibacterium halodurans]MED4082261.1 ribulokinase [Halalkalibacterium halodurans]MED4083588.1 ribulokinase [Halalkalibacterium halodurans]MED4105901.1 ribulokinase [Halalkalibacterium halodurans]MED4110013.1 ribulokinase [Halalkalibacterium halodurans]MED4149354.1 ribulokinase [Halalkalibacterium halodurans]